HLAVDPYHPFRAQFFRRLERRRIRVGDALGQPVMVAQVDEQHTAVVADAMAPAGQADLFANVALAERAAGVGPVTMHGISRKQLSEGSNRGLNACPELREGLAEGTVGGNRMRRRFWARKRPFPRLSWSP